MSSTNGHGPKKAILYARAATKCEGESRASISRQLEALREYADRAGYAVLEEVADPGQSGASLDRPGMERVRRLVARGGVASVLTEDRDRLSRRPLDRLILGREFEESGCETHAIREAARDAYH